MIPLVLLMYIDCLQILVVPFLLRFILFGQLLQCRLAQLSTGSIVCWHTLQCTAVMFPLVHHVMLEYSEYLLNILRVFSDSSYKMNCVSINPLLLKHLSDEAWNRKRRGLKEKKGDLYSYEQCWLDQFPAKSNWFQGSQLLTQW